MKVADISQIKIVGKNNKYYKNFNLTEEYKEFQKEIYYRCKPVKIEKPYGVLIHFNMYHDIDAPVQAVLDVLEKKGVIENDRYILELQVFKKPIKRGRLGSVEVQVFSLSDAVGG